VVLVGTHIHAGVLEALAYGRSLRPHFLHALYVAFDDEAESRMRRTWDRYGFETALDVAPSPYRSLTGPVLDYLEELERRRSHDVVTVILPEFVVHRWWEQFLHNQSALLLKARLLFRRGTVVTSIPYEVP
jgi:hypothetical protein